MTNVSDFHSGPTGEGLLQILLQAGDAGLVVMVAPLGSHVAIDVNAAVHSHEKGIETKLHHHRLAFKRIIDRDFGRIGLAGDDLLKSLFGCHGESVTDC